MKFLCGSCRTKYQISDEKVRGKILTIRCKKCGAKIIVRESLVRDSPDSTVVAPVAEGPSSNPAAAPSSGSGGALSQALDRAMASTDTHDLPLSGEMATDYEWYIAVDGVQSGPFPYAHVVQQVETGRVQGRNYVWNESMEAWTRIREVPGLKDLLPADSQIPAPPPPAPTSTGDLQLGGDKPLDASELPTTATASTLFGDGEQGGTQVEQAATQVVATSGTTATASGKPGNSLDELLALGQDGDLFANVPRATEADLVPKESTRFFVKAAGVRNTKSRNRLATLVAAMAVLLLLGFVGSAAAGWIKVEIPGIGNPFERGGDGPEVYSGEADDPDSVKGLLGSKKPGRKKQDRDRAVRRSAGRNTTRSGPGGEYIDDDGAGTGLGGSRGVADAESIELEMKGTDGVRGVPGISDAPLPEADVEIPQVSRADLSEDAIRSVVNARKSSVRICYEQSLRGQDNLRGKLEISVTVEPSGRVSKSVVKTPKFKGSLIGKCIADKIREWRFPDFQGEATTFEVPFVLERSAY